MFEPSGQRSWLQTHAAVPIAELLSGAHVRIYFSARDALGRSHTGSFITDLSRPGSIEALDETPILSPGPLGGFDDSGTMATWLTRVGNQRYLYYIGWNRTVTVPFRNAIGLAVSRDGGPFERLYPGPILDRTHDEPYFTGSCCVLNSEGRWRMWYLSCTGWQTGPNGPRHRYHIKYADSFDGIFWQRGQRVAIDFSSEDECAIARPSVIKDPLGFRMWYCHRGEAYRLGYAESAEGVHWTRRDALSGIEPSAFGWDSEMICYPHVFDHQGQRYLLYNGNGYGASGIGLAVLEGSSPSGVR